MNTNPYYADSTVVKTDWLWVGSLAAGIAMAVGILLPWATVTIFLGSINVNGIDTNDAPIFGGIAAAVMVCSYLRQYAAVFWMGVVGIICSVYEAVDINNIGNKAEVQEIGARVSIGIGLYLIATASILAIIISYIQWNRTRVK